ncbi:hypothetical protein SAMN04488028_1172 [Reichenbachiella agariperforans]|uniref:Uncharacterized protein n=1 Tax=Reichenbachiella agariperforans TaxID=156994 RepID=A0A1M6WXS2_REIAG|nr:hypothetical protein SAMN04488028_1172 [Reichenbachiella agariperforans]
MLYLSPTCILLLDLDQAMYTVFSIVNEQMLFNYVLQLFLSISIFAGLGRYVLNTYNNYAFGIFSKDYTINFFQPLIRVSPIYFF